MIIIIIITVPCSPTHFTIIARAVVIRRLHTYIHTVFKGIIWDCHRAQRIIKCKRCSSSSSASSSLQFFDVYTPNVCFHPAHFSPTISYFYSFYRHPHQPPQPLHTLFFPFAVIDGVRQQSTEQRVANSPRQPASEGEGERLVWWWW